MCDKRPLLRVQSNQMVIKERDPFIWLAPHLAGDERSYREYSERLIRDLKCYFAGNRCPQPDELTSEVLLRLVRKLDEGEPEGRDSETARRQYVFGIAKFVLMEWRRGTGARDLSLPETESLQPSVPPVDLAHAQCLELLKEVVRKSLSLLNPAERDLLSQSELNSEYVPTLADLARQIGVQPAAVRQRAHRARKSFRKLLLMSDRLRDLFRCLGMEPVDA